MDELCRQLKNFITALTRFNQNTGSRWRNLTRKMEEAHEVWDSSDPTRQEFEREWGELAGAIELYQKKQGAAYLEFLQKKKRALDQYFGRPC